MDTDEPSKLLTGDGLLIPDKSPRRRTCDGCGLSEKEKGHTLVNRPGLEVKKTLGEESGGNIRSARVCLRCDQVISRLEAEGNKVLGIIVDWNFLGEYDVERPKITVVVGVDNEPLCKHPYYERTMTGGRQ